MLAEAKQFAEGIHAVFPHAMLAYNLSPSFNWSAAGMGDDDILNLQTELGRLGFVSHTHTAHRHTDWTVADLSVPLSLSLLLT